MTDLLLSNLGSCPEALEWVASQADQSPEGLWAVCPRGDWLLLVAARVGVDRGLIVEAACDCAETGLIYVPTGEQRPRRAIEVARRWARGEATLEEVRAAAAEAAEADAEAYGAAYADHGVSAACDAAYGAAYADRAARAADSDADAGAYYCARAVRRAADADAAYATRAARAAARAARADEARRASLARSADMVRARIPWPLVAAALGGGR